MAEQKIMIASEDYSELDRYFSEINAECIMLVCDGSVSFLKTDGYFKNLTERTGVRIVRFSDFSPNPLYESVVEGVKIFKNYRCDTIVAVGGGSAIDVAKCIKLYSDMDDSENYLKQEIRPNDIPFLAVPTTAGTGSEATRYAVIYYNGEKQSVTDYSCIPSAVLFDASVLKTLPEYQKKSTMLDALCHAIESFWSVNSTDESKKYSAEAISMIFENARAYLANDETANAKMLRAANIAGKAINITQTTAGHAMCYKLTSIYGIAHGHAAALCDMQLMPYMCENSERCIDSRGADYLRGVFADIAESMGCESFPDACGRFKEFVKKLELPEIRAKSPHDTDILKKSVNPVRLKNHPVKLDEVTIENLYRQILE